MTELKDNLKMAEVIVKVKFITDISLWNALKLRLAGGKAIKRFIDTKLEKMNEL